MLKVISGGQTGIDQVGLKAAKAAGLATGGTAPKGFRTGAGPRPELGTVYGLKESWSPDWNPRTEANVIDSDATVLFGDTKSPGTKLTIKYLKNHRKPYIENPTIDELKSFILEKNVSVLNVAGNRGTKISEGQRSHVGLLLLTVFTYFNMLSNSVPGAIDAKSE